MMPIPYQVPGSDQQSSAENAGLVIREKKIINPIQPHKKLPKRAHTHTLWCPFISFVFLIYVKVGTHA